AIGTGSALAKAEPGAAARKPAAAKPEGAGAGKGDSSSTKATSDKSTSDKSTAAKPPSAAASGPPQRFDIDEFRIEGADSLPQIEVEAAVYPFLGPRRTSDDVEKARAAVEKAYHDKGLQTVGVAVPQQDAQRGFIVLKVTENRIGRLRVKGSRYFDLANIKEG